VFSVGSVPRSYKRAQSEDGTEYNGVQNRSREELGRVLEMAVEGDRGDMVRKELNCNKKTHV
jgi:hypothetical protein